MKMRISVRSVSALLQITLLKTVGGIVIYWARLTLSYCAVVCHEKLTFQFKIPHKYFNDVIALGVGSYHFFADCVNHL